MRPAQPCGASTVRTCPVSTPPAAPARTSTRSATSCSAVTSHPTPRALPPREAAAAAAAKASPYPDPLCRALRAAVAAHDGVAPGQVLCGGGAAELIFRLAYALRPRRALVTAPTFSEYEGALSAAGCAVTRHLLRRAEL